MEFLPQRYLPAYRHQQPLTLSKHVARLRRFTQSHDEFDFYAVGAAVYSSRIEGNSLDLETYWRYRDSGIGQGSKTFREVEDLRVAYELARKNPLTLPNLLAAHDVAMQTVLDADQYRGRLRTVPVGVYSGRTKIYAAASPEVVESEVSALFVALDQMKGEKLDLSETFYFASLLHLQFAHIHPFADGNGRMARLLEKWFLAEKLGPLAWYVQSERYYHDQRLGYYRNISLGAEYAVLNYDQCLPFLLMLPWALKLR